MTQFQQILHRLARRLRTIADNLIHTVFQGISIDGYPPPVSAQEFLHQLGRTFSQDQQPFCPSPLLLYNRGPDIGHIQYPSHRTPLMMALGFHTAEYFREKRVLLYRMETGKKHIYHKALPVPALSSQLQAPGVLIRHIIQVPRRLPDPFCHLPVLTLVPGIIQHPGHGGDRGSRQLRDLL